MTCICIDATELTTVQILRKVLQNCLIGYSLAHVVFWGSIQQERHEYLCYKQLIPFKAPLWRHEKAIQAKFVAITTDNLQYHIPR